MLLKEELIEKMARAIINRSEYAVTPEQRQRMLCEEQPYWNDVAKAALGALLDNLPTPIDGYQNKHDMYYRQLMAMRDK